MRWGELAVTKQRGCQREIKTPNATDQTWLKRDFKIQTPDLGFLT
jgi:hypothetical protein